MKVLLIGPSRDRGEALAAALAPDVALHYAPDGFYALTMIERERPDLVLLRSAMAGLTAADVAAIIHNDPVHRGVRLGLLATAAERAGLGSDLEVHLEFDADLPAAELAREIRCVTAGPPDQAQLARTSRSGPPIQTLSGTLSVLGLSDLVQALSDARSAGRLTVEWADGTAATIHLAGGRILDAAWEDWRGEEAFLEILSRGGKERDSCFRFEAMPWHELFARPRTINRTVRELLLTTAIALDESGRWRQGA
jgi:CheY-like chemotaxis protein